MTEPNDDPQVCLRGGEPIDQQIYEQVRACIVSGQMQPGEQLPSARGLAVELAVNPAAVERAYGWLEQERLVSTVDGSGVRIVGGDEPDAPSRQMRLEQFCREFLARAVSLGFTPDEVLTTSRAIHDGRL